MEFKCSKKMAFRALTCGRLLRENGNSSAKSLIPQQVKVAAEAWA